jgi:hypothetical protein
MQGEKVTKDLARGIGRVAHAKTYDRIVAGKRTLAYVNPRRDGVQLDFSAADLAGAPGHACGTAPTVKRDRALLIVNGKNMEPARALLEHVRHKKENR